MGALALNAGLTLAFVFPVITCLLAGALAGMVAKRAKASETLAAAYPATGAMSLIEE
jgi:hypothetical protein